MDFSKIPTDERRAEVLAHAEAFAKERGFRCRAEPGKNWTYDGEASGRPLTAFYFEWPAARPDPVSSFSAAMLDFEMAADQWRDHLNYKLQTGAEDLYRLIEEKAAA